MSQAKAAPLSSQVSFEGVITYLEPCEAYVEAADRSSGIRVLADTEGRAIGDAVSVTGKKGIVSGEPCVVLASISPGGAGAVISPFAISNQAIGGWGDWAGMRVWDYARSTGDWLPACGGPNTGLLVTTWGIVRSVYHSPTTGASWFYVDDGSRAVSDLGDIGVLVYSEAEPARGSFVSVTGISSTEPSIEDPTRLVRVIRIRGPEDIRTISSIPQQGGR